MAGVEYTPSSITLTAAQAAHAAPILAADSARQAVMLRLPSDCELTLDAGDVLGAPLFAGVPNQFVGLSCPTNALYLVGLAEGDVVTVWTA